MLPLDGLTVVALEQAIAAPFASRQLADLGARVIKIERPPAGDFARSYDAKVKGLSSHFVWVNRSKESLSLDLRKPAARGVLERLLEKADVLIQNLAPGAVERLGFSAARLRELYPRLVVCSISGYGAAGPYRDRRAYDLLVQSEAGVVSITGTEETPCKAGIPVADIAGGMYAFSGILAALLRRGRTGEGALVEVSLFDALIEWMGYPIYYTVYGGSAPGRSGAHHAAIAPYGPFAAGDGEIVFLGIQNEPEWARFCEQVLERPDLLRDPRFEGNSRRVENRAALHRVIEEEWAKRSAAEIRAGLERARIAFAGMSSVAALLDHPQLRSRGRFKSVDSPAGELPALLPPIEMEDADPRMAAIPALGEHTDSILEELGFDRSAIEEFRSEGIV